MITLIVARDRNGAIGKDNTIPWHAPEDLKFFQRETLGGAIIMGRNTWGSLPFKPLKKRLNLVVSSNRDLCENVCSSVREAIGNAEAQGYRRLYGIGGASIYSEMLALADRMLITEVDLEIDGADTFFPTFEPQDWIVSAPVRLRWQEAPKCSAFEYIRKNS